MNEHPRLFLPGPTEVDPSVLAAMARPMIGHRSEAFRDFYRRVTDRLATFLSTERPVFLATGSATMIMEAALVNGVARRSLHLVNGAFGRRWAEIAERLGLPHDIIEVEWGQAQRVEALEEALATDRYDAVTIVHSETSTGVLNPLPELARVVRAHDDVLLLVDAVSSMGAVQIDFDALGIDVVFAGIQKAFSCPPGLVVFAVSDRAMERSAQRPHKGYFLDFEVYAKSHAKGQTITTPAISQLFALDEVLSGIFEEGPEAVYARHRRMSNRTREWAEAGLGLFPDPAHLTPSLTCVQGEAIDIAALQQHVLAHGAILGGGYGPLKQSTFRIAHMGSTTPDDLEELLGWIDEFLAT